VGTQITQPYDEPFYGGGDSGTSAIANIGGSFVAVNGRVYPIDTASNRYAQRNLDVLQQRNTTDNRDVLLLPQNVWRQQISGWYSGAGQSNLDRDDAIQTRYENSFGIDPWTKWQMQLLPATEEMQALTGQSWLSLVAGNLVVVNDNDSYWWSDFGTMTASVTVGSVSTVDVAENAPTLITLNSDGHIFQVTSSGGSATLYYNQALANANMITWVKDYLIVGHENVLKWVGTNNTVTTIYTHPDPGFRWVAGCEGPQAIYLLGGLGDQYVVHKVTIKDDGSGLNPAIVAVELPDGEIGYSIGEYLGFVFIGTDKGVRMAQPSANADLTLGAVLPTDDPVRCFEGQDRFVWYGVSSMDPDYVPVSNDQGNVFPTSPVPGLGRMDLTTFTTTALTPAYANDIAVWTEAAANVTSCVTFLGKRVFAVTGAGVFYEGADKVEGGWLTQGTMSFSVEDLKSALYMQLKWVPNTANSRVFLDLSFDSTLFGRYARLNTTSTSIRSDNINLAGTKFSRVNLRYVLLRAESDATQGPVPTRWEFRAFPVKGKASRWDVPLILADEVDINGMIEARNPVSDKAALVGLIQNGTVFQYQESGQAYQVLARDFIWQPERLSSTGNGWQGTFLIVLEEVM
jgi:hypothetical protein